MTNAELDTRLTETAIAFTAAGVNKDSVEYARARGAFYGAVLECYDRPERFVAPPREEPEEVVSMRELMSGPILGGC